MTFHPNRSTLVLSSCLGSLLIGTAAQAEVFYRNTILGEGYRDGMMVDSFEEVAAFDAPEYLWTGFSDSAGAGALIDVRQTSVRIDFTDDSGSGFGFDGDWVWYFNDVDMTMMDFESVRVVGNRSRSVDWSLVQAEVVDADTFSIDFSALASDPGQIINDGDRVRVVMTFVPAPAGALALLGVGLGSGGRRRRA